MNALDMAEYSTDISEVTEKKKGEGRHIREIL